MDIIMIKGKVKFTITIDPGVWIFDDRKVDLKTYFQESRAPKDDLETYTKEVSAHWDREIREGAIVPPTLKTEKVFKKTEILTGTFGMPLEPFLGNAEVLPEASEVVFITKQGEIVLSVEKAKIAILGFSKNGKPFKEDGPVHLYYGDGSNRDNPVTNIEEILVR
ncbi:peptidyl-prolyl cis-trans isomerase [Bacillus lacus]|uniref:Peptidyl-prolyl cis-trans isomerase n=1 Tax=Metabacillus lacus TaxID=1983721 RepID=A0A7X2IXW3_9BACI|nr:peptidyl-prolyl cis-trans isomerase [Metabacillus lacus]MRX71684.1 peptidyl-prolyl cis-trans isomerase [Metabacillus lacus]